jgi:hypothetical protein
MELLAPKKSNTGGKIVSETVVVRWSDLEMKRRSKKIITTMRCGAATVK